jgi:Fic family protein
MIYWDYILKKIGNERGVMSESIGLMEPMLVPEGLLSQGGGSLADLALDLVAKANHLAGKLHPMVRRSLGDLVRPMNCYYSNLIEGHNTHPRAINDALAQDFSHEPAKRALQEEAVAHITVQQLIDTDQAPMVNPLSSEFGRWIHHAFCSRLPQRLLWVENPDTGQRHPVIPGQLRDGTVVVGRHIPPLPENLDRFMARFDQAYDQRALPKLQALIGVAAAHHRYLWIHPFYDGNGRVARLMSHAALRHLGVGCDLWSVARGLARAQARYKELLQNADAPRLNDLDGRGTLSQTALVEFCAFFLGVCIDQVDYMDGLLDSKNLLGRIQLYVAEQVALKNLPKASFALLREALLVGEFERGRAAALTGYQDRMARGVLSQLVARGLLVSDTPKGPVRLGFPIEVVERWFPLLYPGGVW